MAVGTWCATSSAWLGPARTTASTPAGAGSVSANTSLMRRSVFVSIPFVATTTRGAVAKAALLTRGLAEMARLGRALGARPDTLSGLAGMGDLIATATSRHSRNRRLGEAVGRGATLAEALASSPMVAEGVGTCEAAVELARRQKVELPIAEQVHAILFEGKSARAALRELLTRDLKPEAESRVRRES